jgi:hypothetical protein
MDEVKRKATGRKYSWFNKNHNWEARLTNAEARSVQDVLPTTVLVKSLADQLLYQKGKELVEN